ncbi:MAG: DUF3857 domain-containing protein [Deltaproteobacteria bacterium]|nr:DUF3857 domain-containing protein [Deltaproteobacteria bacterium]
MRLASSVCGAWVAFAVGCGGAATREMGNYQAGKAVGLAQFVDAPAIILDEEVELTYTFSSARQPYAELRLHRVLQILTEEGRRRFARVPVSMNRQMEPRAIQARLKHRDGSSDDLRADRTLDFNRFPPSDKAAALYQEPAARVFAVPGLQVGDIIEYQATSIIRDPRWVQPVMAGEDALDLPIQEARLSVVLAPGYDVDFRVTVRGEVREAAPERVPARILDPNTGKDASLDAWRYIWQFKSLAPSVAEPRGYFPMAVATQVHVQFRRFAMPESPQKAFLGYSTWEDVAAWYRDLTGKLDASGSALAPDAKNGKTRKDKLKAVQQGCGQLELVPVELHLGALKFHKPSEVISAKKGDAKDLAQACLSATRAAGLDAFPVLMARRGHRPRVPDLPTPAAFDHVIIAVPGQGTYDFFDPSGLGVPTGRALPWSQGVDGLVIRPDGVERVTVSTDTAEQNLREVNYKLVLSADANIEGSAVFKLTGQDAGYVRQVSRELKGKERLAALSEWLSGGEQKLPWADAQLTDENPDADAPLKLLVTFDKAALGGLPGRLAVRMSELTGKPFPFLWREGRVTPVDLGYRLTERVIATVQMPEGHGTSGRPRDLVDDNAFTKVEQRHVVADGSLWLRRERTVKEPVVAPAQYDELKSVYEKMWMNLDQSTQVVPGGERGREYGADPF